MSTIDHSHGASHGRGSSGWTVALSTGSALAAAMGVGRFAFTPILPLMEAGGRLDPAGASLIATGNYLGYLLGAILGIAVPAISRSRVALRVSAGVLVMTLLLMPITADLTAWIALRVVAGVASAVVFLVAGTAILSELTARRAHLVGWAYGGIGAGIALSGILVAILSAVSDWRLAWVASAALAAVLLAAGWNVGDRGRRGSGTADPHGPRGHGPRFAALAVSYFLEGAGYIIAGTFLVAAVSATGPHWLAASVWIIVGAAAVPSCAAWIWLSLHVSRPTLLTGALALQAVGIALPAISAAPAAAIVSAALFGATFVGITTLSLATGRHLGAPRAVAVLTAGYGIGQVAGPILVTPLLQDGYRPALLVGAVLATGAALGTAAVRIRYPHRGAPHRGDRRFAPSRAE